MGTQRNLLYFLPERNSSCLQRSLSQVCESIRLNTVVQLSLVATACQVAFTFSLTLSDRPAYGPITVSVKVVIGSRLELMSWYASFY